MSMLGPQNEPLYSNEELRAMRPDSVVAAGTDREQAVSNFASKLVGPQGEIIRPVCEEGICPLCQQQWPECASANELDPRAPVEQDSAFIDSLPPQDPTTAITQLDSRENMFELLRSRRHQHSDIFDKIAAFFNVDDDDFDVDDDAMAMREQFAELFKFQSEHPKNYKTGMTAKAVS